jgi:hypothetical protein
MAKNVVQFLNGLSLQEFLEKFGIEEQCHQTRYNLRWPAVYICLECSNTTSCALKNCSVYQPQECHYQTSLTAGSIFHVSKLALRKWFIATYLLTQRSKSTSALQLSREIGVNYPTSWKPKYKLMQMMLERQGRDRLSGHVEIDDTYLGGETSEKPGSSSCNKIHYVANVRPVKIQLRRVQDFYLTELVRYARNIAFSPVALFCPMDSSASEPLAMSGHRMSAQHCAFK